MQKKKQQKTNSLYNLKIQQTDIWEKYSVKKEKKRRKTHLLFENNQASSMFSQKIKKKTTDRIT